jgi:acyl dehydratase
MVATLAYADAEVGTRLPDKEVSVDRLGLMLFGGQTMRLDFAEHHWSERAAAQAGLPNVIMHGPLTLGKTLQIVNDWTGDPGSLVEYQMRFTRPIPVPDDGTGAMLRLSGQVTEKLDDNRVVVDVVATSPSPEDAVLAKLRATVRLA